MIPVFNLNDYEVPIITDNGFFTSVTSHWFDLDYDLTIHPVANLSIKPLEESKCLVKFTVDSSLAINRLGNWGETGVHNNLTVTTDTHIAESQDLLYVDVSGAECPLSRIFDVVSSDPSELPFRDVDKVRSLYHGVSVVYRNCKKVVLHADRAAKYDILEEYSNPLKIDFALRVTDCNKGFFLDVPFRFIVKEDSLFLVSDLVNKSFKVHGGIGNNTFEKAHYWLFNFGKMVNNNNQELLQLLKSAVVKQCVDFEITSGDFVVEITDDYGKRTHC